MDLHHLRAAEKETVLRLPEKGRFSREAILFAHQQMVKDGFQCGSQCSLLREDEIDTPDTPVCGGCAICQKASCGYDPDDITFLLIGAGQNTSLAPGIRFLAYLYWYKIEETCYPWGDPDVLPLDLCALACVDVPHRNAGMGRIWMEQMQWAAIDKLLGSGSVHYLHDKGQEVLLRLPEKGRFSAEAFLFAHQRMIAQEFQCGGTWCGQEYTCNLVQQNEIDTPETPACGGYDEATQTGCKICRNVPMYRHGIPLLLVGVCQNKSLSVLVRFLAALYWYKIEETCFSWDKVNTWPLDLCALVCMDYDHGEGVFGNFLVQTLQWDAMERLLG